MLLRKNMGEASMSHRSTQVCTTVKTLCLLWSLVIGTQLYLLCGDPKVMWVSLFSFLYLYF